MKKKVKPSSEFLEYGIYSSMEYRVLSNEHI